jgi:hypothetical protein
LIFVFNGRFELIDGVAQIFNRQQYAVIPSDVLHSGQGVTDCRLIDIFSPVREDCKNL